MSVAPETQTMLDSDSLTVIPKGYKWTDIGVIPEDWEPKSIGELVSFSGGSQPPRLTFVFNEEEGYVRLIQIRDYKTDEFATYIPEMLASKRCTATDVMIGRYGPPIFQILRGIEGAYNVALIKTVPSSKIDSDYWYHFVRNDRLFRLIDSLSRRSSGQTGVEMSALKSFGLPLPPLPEQRAIASALSDVDALIEALDKLIAKKRDIKQATMQQLLTGKTRLPGFSGEWEVKRLGNVVTFLTTANNPRADLSLYGDVEYIHYGDVHAHAQPILDCRNASLPRIDHIKVTNIPRLVDGDLVIVDASEDLAGVAKSVEVQGVVGKMVVAGLHTILCRGNPNQWAKGFMAYLQFIPAFKSALDRVATGISVYAVSKKQIADVDLALPSVEEQHAIATVLSDLDAEMTALERRLDKTKQIKQGMMQMLLTGRVRLVEPEKAEANS